MVEKYLVVIKSCNNIVDNEKKSKTRIVIVSIKIIISINNYDFYHFLYFFYRFFLPCILLIFDFLFLISDFIFYIIKIFNLNNEFIFF